jgi:hypothetical protein
MPNPVVPFIIGAAVVAAVFVGVGAMRNWSGRPRVCSVDADCGPTDVCRSQLRLCVTPQKNGALCLANKECQSGVCNNYKCTPCLTSDSCVAPSVCRADGTCGACGSDADCPAETICDNGQCVDSAGRCRLDADCVVGSFCDLSGGPIGICTSRAPAPCFDSPDFAEDVMASRWNADNSAQIEASLLTFKRQGNLYMMQIHSPIEVINLGNPFSTTNAVVPLEFQSLYPGPTAKIYDPVTQTMFDALVNIGSANLQINWHPTRPAAVGQIVLPQTLIWGSVGA